MPPASSWSGDNTEDKRTRVVYSVDVPVVSAFDTTDTTAVASGIGDKMCRHKGYVDMADVNMQTRVMNTTCRTT